MNWLLDGMIYLGSALMVYNIYSYVRYAKNLQKKEDWGKERNVLYIPIVLLVLFLMGYLAVGLFGKPDLIVSGILFGGSIFVFIIFRLLQFITLRVQKNEHLEAKLLAAEQSSNEKSQFLSNVSHEMRTPMNGIIGLDYLALKRPDLPAETRRQLEKIGENADYLRALIDNILDMSDMDAGKIVLKNDTFSLIELLNDVNLMLRSQCSRKGLDYSYVVIGTLSDYYVGDKRKVRQMLLSLLGNAVKFTPAPGTVTFTAEETESYLYSKTLRFTVSDTGVGMDEEFMSKIFTPFTREHNSNTDIYGGIGLSLAVAQKVAKLMRGSIEVESEKGVGSTFTATVMLGLSNRKADRKEKSGIPAENEKPGTEEPLNGEKQTETKPDESAFTDVTTDKTGQDHSEPDAVQSESDPGKDNNNPEPEPENSADNDSFRVLIAEDIDLNAEILADLLEMEDISSERAENGEIAVRMFSESPENYYDAVLMDLRMPVMDGLDAARNIRSLDRQDAGTVPIIALTANASYDDRENVIRAGMDSHLSKPIDSELLFETLDRLTKRSRETV